MPVKGDILDLLGDLDLSAGPQNTNISGWFHSCSLNSSAGLRYSYKLVKILFVCACLDVNQSGTYRNHCKQELSSCMHRPANESWWHARNHVTCFTGENIFLKLGVNRHFKPAHGILVVVIHCKNCMYEKNWPSLVLCTSYQKWWCKGKLCKPKPLFGFEL